MNRPIRTEYENLRKEIEAVKKCITDYQGYLFTTTGVLITAWGLTATLQQNNVFARHAMGTVALAASMIVTFMMTILVYKFVSHNRAAGYSLLLTSEIWPPERENSEIILWELCVNWLRAGENPEHDELDAYGEAAEVLKGEKARRNPSTFTAGMVFLARALLSFQKSSSWGFPITVVRIFAFMVLALVLTGTVLQSDLIRAYVATPVRPPLPIIFWFTVIVLQLLLWLNISRRFHSVMIGNSTVIRFAQRFLPIRRELLKNAIDFAPPSTLDADHKERPRR